MRDILPADARRWREVEKVVTSTLLGYAYEEIELPLIEHTELFARGVGEATDAVEKEMYSFHDRDGESIALRPEGTAGCARALMQNGLLYNQTQRVFYSGHMFRYERPQRGRYRQFYQIGAEAFGLAGAEPDAELIQMGWSCWQRLGVENDVRLELNTIGSGSVRTAYRRALVDYLTPHREALDPDSQRRLESNPMRILDSKSETTRAVAANAPRLTEFLDEASIQHYERVKELLAAMDIPFVENPQLMRGLDYYTDTVFEWITDRLGAQGTICAGGRYDNLVEHLGGPATPGSGFAIGLDRVVLLHEEVNAPGDEGAADVYCCVMTTEHTAWVFDWVERLRRAVPRLRIRMHLGGGKLKNQFKRADQSGARWALVVGEDEVANRRVGLKHLREGGQQEQVDFETLLARLTETSN
jgi:histidyl-tRNA synthetase